MCEYPTLDNPNPSLLLLAIRRILRQSLSLCPNLNLYPFACRKNLHPKVKVSSLCVFPFV